MCYVCATIPGMMMCVYECFFTDRENSVISGVPCITVQSSSHRAGLGQKLALAFLLRPAHQNWLYTTHRYTILAVPVNMHTYCSIPQNPYKAEY